MVWTTDDLVRKARREAKLPNVGGPTAAEILEVAYQETLARIIPALRSTRENYGVEDSTTTLVADQADYDIPALAQGATLREVILESLSGSTVVGTVRLAEVPIQAAAGYLTAAKPHAFAIQGNSVKLLPTPNTANAQLRFRYYRRPGIYVETSSCAATTAAPSGQTLTVASHPFAAADLVEVVLAVPHFDIEISEGLVDSTTATTVVMDAGVTVPTDLPIGSWICVSGETCVPYLPDVMHDVLSHFTAAQMLIEVGDREGASLAMAVAEQRLQTAIGALDPRVDGVPKPIVNPYSPLRSSLRFGRGRRF
jgi:hypothetical protein